MSKQVYVLALTYAERHRVPAVKRWNAVDLWRPGTKEQGNGLDECMEFMLTYPGDCTYYIHNLKFWGSFVVTWLFENGFECREEPDDGTFTAVISGDKEWYKLLIRYGNRQITILDSQKIIPYPSNEIWKKMGIDPLYVAQAYGGNYMEAGMLREAILRCQKMGIHEMTIGSSAIKSFKSQLGKDKYRRLFPELPEAADTYCRKAYKGGFNFVNPAYQGRSMGKGKVLDINGMYPYILREKPLPYGHPTYFEGKYVNDPYKPLYIQRVQVILELKKDGIPSVVTNYSLDTDGCSYIASTNGEWRELYLTNLDLELMIKNYVIKKSNIRYIDGYKFYAAEGLFKNYVNYWDEIKTEAEKEGHKGTRTIAKLMQNTLIGKMGKKRYLDYCYPEWDYEKGDWDYGDILTRDCEGEFLPVSVFVNSYGRYWIINDFVRAGAAALYCDVDSIHLAAGVGDFEKSVAISQTELGKYKVEFEFDNARYLKSKCYILVGHDADGNEVKKITCAGLAEICHSQVTYDNFKPGTVYHNNPKLLKLKPGAIYENTDYELRA